MLDVSVLIWNDDVSILDRHRLVHRHIHSLRRLTDLYLLALSVKNGGRFVTFDLRLPRNAVAGAPQSLVVL